MPSTSLTFRFWIYFSSSDLSGLRAERYPSLKPLETCAPAPLASAIFPFNELLTASAAFDAVSDGWEIACAAVFTASLLSAAPFAIRPRSCLPDFRGEAGRPGFSIAFPTLPMPLETALPAETAPWAAIRAAWYAPQLARRCRA